MNKYVFLIFLSTFTLTAQQTLAANPLKVSITNENLDTRRFPGILMRSAPVSNNLQDLNISTPPSKKVATDVYTGCRNSLGLYLDDKEIGPEQIAINVCSVHLKGTVPIYPFFSISEKAQEVNIVLNQLRDGNITASITTNPANLVSVNTTLEIPLGGIPFEAPGALSEED